MNGDADAIIIDGALFSQYSEGIQSVLLERGIPIIIMDMSSEQKDVLIDQMTFGTPGSSYAYSVLPFTDKNKVRHHRIVDVPNKAAPAKRATIQDNGRRSDFVDVELEMNFEESAKMFSDEIFASVVNGVFDPPANMTPPQGALYAILPYTMLGSYTANLQEMNKGGSQTVSHRLDNNFYNYRENGFGEDGYFMVLMQDGIVSPGSLIISDPTQAIGFYQFLFSVANQPYPNGALPDSNTFYWSQSSPATVDQTVSETSSVSESLSLEVDMTVDGPSSKISVTWTASNSITSEIEQWGIVEDSVPINSTTVWTYHQQLPYDPFELDWYQFGNWWGGAYSGNDVKALPDLSTNTLQAHTISAWYASGSLRSGDGSLPVQTVSTRNHEVAIVCTPKFYNGHHYVEWYTEFFNFPFKMDLNSFPNSTSVN
eukprot:Phypoly_transcript_06601.p1 GENE.Phypoly_transcript_06601~~Phypoly_transcript_06601.p1  ORF type:complete len:462 (+),score=76.40 Phypoly_transcript_06601:106-1386(+)